MCHRPVSRMSRDSLDLQGDPTACSRISLQASSATCRFLCYLGLVRYLVVSLRIVCSHSDLYMMLWLQRHKCIKKCSGVNWQQQIGCSCKC